MTAPAFVDTHAHIHDLSFEDAAAAIARARDAGVTTIVTLGVALEDSRRAIALAERHDGVLAAVGVHPHDAGEATEADLDELERLAMHPRVRLIGEIGLDYYRNLSPHETQRRVLLRQLDTAERARKPIAVHAREAHDDMLPILSEWSRHPGKALQDRGPLGVMHYFSGDTALALRYIDLGFMISVHTSVTHPRSTTLRAVAREAPLSALVIETDSPYGAPQRYRGKRNEPAYVVEAAAKISELRDIDLRVVAGATTENALRLLG